MPADIDEARSRARDWMPLRRAIFSLVRLPLKNDPELREVWRESDSRAFAVLQDCANKGKTSPYDDLRAVRCATLLYSCMHFDALRALMDAPALEPMFAALQGGGSRSCLHIDFGSGPGTATWALTHALAGRTRVTTIGYDHNRDMCTLARDMSDRVALQARRRGDRRLFVSDPVSFRHEAIVRAKRGRFLVRRRWNAVVVTANSVFGQNDVTREDVGALVDLIKELRDRVRAAPMFVIGTHPPYNEDKVRDAWRRIAEIPGAETLHDDVLHLISGSFRGYDSRTAWKDFAPKPQLAHIVRVTGRSA